MVSSMLPPDASICFASSTPACTTTWGQHRSRGECEVSSIGARHAREHCNISHNSPEPRCCGNAFCSNTCRGPTVVLLRFESSATPFLRLNAIDKPQMHLVCVESGIHGWLPGAKTHSPLRSEENRSDSPVH